METAIRPQIHVGVSMNRPIVKPIKKMITSNALAEDPQLPLFQNESKTTQQVILLNQRVLKTLTWIIHPLNMSIIESR